MMGHTLLRDGTNPVLSKLESNCVSAIPRVITDQKTKSVMRFAFTDLLPEEGVTLARKYD